MEKYYFIEKDGAKLGPFKLDDLKSQIIYFDELIWRSDSENWKKASEFEELNGVYIIKPPPTPIEQESATAIDNKKTVDISEQLIVSLVIGFSISLVIILLAHVSPSDWSAMPITNGSGYFTYGDKVSSCSYECLLGERHSANCSGLSVYEAFDKSLTINEVFSGSFEHLSTMGIIGLILATIIYIFKRVNFQVVK